MYGVSEDFKAAIIQNTRRYYWSGQITTKSGTVHAFDESSIVKGSGCISSACCGSTELEIGGVYASELEITLLTQIDRYSLEDAVIEVFFNLLLPGGTYETVPMGIFEISEANRRVKCLEIKAYDYMLRFDKAFGGFSTTGRPYAFLSFCANACGVSLAQTQAEIEGLPNGRQELAIYSENDIETYRDVLFYVAQVLGGFCVIDREGKLEVRCFGTTPVLEVSDRHRFTSSFSDFVTRYTAVSSTNRRTEIAEYYHIDPDDGLTMNLGINPLLQYGLVETRRTVCMKILEAITVIGYLPFESDTIGNPALDLGDVIRFTGGQADGSKISAITSIKHRIGGRQNLKCVGKNPRLAQAKSKNDKNISGLLNEVEAGKIAIHTFSNADDISISSSDTKVIQIEFATTEADHAQFFAQIVLDVDADVGSLAEVTVTYFFNNYEILTFHPKQSVQSGYHTLSLYYPIKNIISNEVNLFEVYINISGGSAEIDAGHCIASISGQSMAAVQVWDGNIVIAEEIAVQSINATGISAVAFDESIGFELIDYDSPVISDAMARALIGGFGAVIEL